MSIENWLIKLVNKYRTTANKSSLEIRQKLTLDDFMPKCQLELLQFSDPDWNLTYDIEKILIEIYEQNLSRW